MLVTINTFINVISYNAVTGEFHWLKNRGGKAIIGSVAGAIDSKGYRQIRVFGKTYLAHRLAWFFHYKIWPINDIDHIDRNPRNNAIENLRECLHFENHQNLGVRSDNTSRITGVSFNKLSGKWLAYINLNGKRYRLGLFSNLNDAIVARVNAKKILHVFNPTQNDILNFKETNIK